MSYAHYRVGWDYEGSASLKIILLALAKHTDDAGRCYPSIATLAHITGLNRSTVMRGLDQLEREGVVERARSRGRKATQYRLSTVAQCDGSRGATGRTVQPQPSHSAASTVAPCDINSRTVRHELINEQSIEQTNEHSASAGDDSEWRQFLIAYPKAARPGDKERFQSLDSTTRAASVKAASVHAFENPDMEPRYFPSVQNFLADVDQIHVMAGRYEDIARTDEPKPESPQGAGWSPPHEPISDEQHAATLRTIRELRASTPWLDKGATP